MLIDRCLALLNRDRNLSILAPRPRVPGQPEVKRLKEQCWSELRLRVIGALSDIMLVSPASLKQGVSETRSRTCLWVVPVRPTYPCVGNRITERGGWRVRGWWGEGGKAVADMEGSRAATHIPAAPEKTNVNPDSHEC